MYQIKRVDWRFVLANQNWSTWLISIPALVLLGVAHWNIKPKEREFYITHAQISYKYENIESISATAALVLQLGAWIIFAGISEFYSHRERHEWGWTRSLTLFLHFTLDTFQSFFVSMMAQQCSAVAVGKWRPDFLGRCKPTYSDPSFYDDPAWMHPLTRDDCQNPSSGAITAGLWGFPSGHAQFVLTIWAHGTVYALWTTYFRRPMNRFNQPLGLQARLWKEFVQVVVLFYVLITFAWAYIVSLSRYLDNKHAIEDIVAGMMLGIIFGVIYCIRAIGVAQLIPQPQLESSKASEKQESASTTSIQQPNGVSTISDVKIDA
eukprot:TRINITY_DN4456_c0_g1_i10.p1 TRINITY_DN4456_c0_g1~~TRINITY_DN4456_c0_g1_i10.p1  ORF type:complete len:321 (-),score=16.69 TRINITY_DN4456_c0_g1_i10:358-1320(-)